MNSKNIPAYELIMQENIPDVQSMGYLLKHRKSGARVLILENEDDNKVFNIAFRTTPSDSTGVAHIMEHTVLCGSRKFPSKDPFVELVKGSMNTFLNAMTYPDKTMFPVASCNDADFANLMDVYLDAVFFPNIYKKEEIFRQEGWHYQIENPDDELEYNGVVYNEMKGAFSSPEAVLERVILNSLFPDNTYHYESGGDPECIPDLTYEDYLDFHRTYYHPENSYIYLYGNMDMEERLNWLDREYLGGFERETSGDEHHGGRAARSVVAYQKPFDRMREVYRKYPIAQADTEEDNTYLAYNVAIGTSLDTRLSTAFAVLEYALLETPGAPLKEALLDAGIGKDIMSSYDSGTFQPVFSIIAKNANISDKDAFYQLIFDKLNEIAEKGVDENAIRAAINIMEFKFREADYGSYPKGLMYGIDVFDSWLYDDSRPFDYLKQIDDFDYLKSVIGTGYYEELIRTWILNNTHASFVIVEPEKGLTARMEQEVQDKLHRIKVQMTEKEIRDLIEKTEKLRLFQETPSTQEELEAIPMLSREDLKKDVLPLRNKVLRTGGVTLLHQDYATNGIAYIQLLFDASVLAQEDLPYLSILKKVLGMVDTEHYSYSELSNVINMNTGGISAGISVFPDDSDSSRLRAALGIQARVLKEKIPFAFQMIEEILFTSNLRQEKRLKEIIGQTQSRTYSMLNSSGSATAGIRCMSYFSNVHLYGDMISGIEFYKEVERLEKDFEEKKEELKDRLCALAEKLIRKEGLMLSFTGPEDMLDDIKEGIARLTDRMTDREKEAELLPLAYVTGLQTEKKNEGFLTPAKVQYVARCGNFRKHGMEYTGALRVLKVIMSYEYLWSNIRVIGGAYGCSGSFGRNGDCSLVSYRDPQLRKTNEVYEGIPAYLEQFTVDARDMTKYVIGTISDMDTPLNPSALGRRSMTAFLTGVTEEILQKDRSEVLNVTVEDIRALAPMLQAILDDECICVLGNEEKLRSEKDLFMELREF